MIGSLRGQGRATTGWAGRLADVLAAELTGQQQERVVSAVVGFYGN